ncbi:hypothetical protein KY359_05775 [Candidatus Woesearchaeota archaeon]|nr:hypothetical protein [Candidatus Woesearchaeota archaeon]
MRCIRVNIKKIEVERFSTKEGVDLSIVFDDGGKKCLKYSTKLENVFDDVKNIITKIQVYEKSQNRVLDAEDVLDSFVSIVIENDEEVMEKIRTFLARLKDDRSRLRNYGTHQGYIESLNKMQKKVLELKPGAVRNES